MMLRDNNLIAIGGLRNSGKDTATKMLQYLLNSPKWLHSYFFYQTFNTLFKKGKFKVTSFAHPLKKTLAALLDVPIERFEDRSFKEDVYIYFPTMDLYASVWPSLKITDSKFNKCLQEKDFSFLESKAITIRQLLQLFGTQVMRDTFGNQIWILLTLKNVRKTIISDLRFKVEAEAVKEKSGKLIYIKRDLCKPGNHASEQEVLDLYNDNAFDYVIENNKSLKDLFNNLKSII